MPDTGTLHHGEPHPAAYEAREWLCELAASTDLSAVLEGMASAALARNRLAEVCLATLTRLLHGQPVSDTYILGLAWTLRHMEIACPAKFP